MIDGLNVNHKVGRIDILINNHNGINGEVIRKMVHNYDNVYSVCIYDHLDLVDDSIHE